MPFRSVTIKPNEKPWYCNTLRALKRKRDRLFRKFKMTKLEIDWSAYKKIRNKYAHELSKAVSDYNKKLFDSLNDCSVSEKGWWRTIRVFFSGSKQKVGSICTDTKDKANLLNKMFSSYSEINDSDRRPPDLDFKTGSRLEQIYLSESDVLDIKINKATGPDDISPTLLKNTAEVITNLYLACLTNLFHQILIRIFGKLLMLFQYLKKGTVTYVTIIAQCLYWAFQGYFLKNAFSNTCSITTVTIIWYIKCSLVLCRKTVRQTNWYFYTILLLKL